MSSERLLYVIHTKEKNATLYFILDPERFAYILVTAVSRNGFTCSPAKIATAPLIKRAADNIKRLLLMILKTTRKLKLPICPTNAMIDRQNKASSCKSFAKLSLDCIKIL
jgi:hypothetical protein